uniref:Uncharacterized protein n=1 Tax=Rhizophora mucronata TaxID=61149 RepID=A0A2P2PQ05_RHIMU
MISFTLALQLALRLNLEKYES